MKKLLDTHKFFKRKRVTRYIIFGLQRTGTSLLVTLLQSHPEILSLGEIFDDKEKTLIRDIQTYKLYAKHRFPNKGYDPAHQKNAIYQYLDSIYSRKDAKAIGFKLMLNQTKNHPGVLDYLKEKQFKIICVLRINLLNTVISRMRSRQLGIFDSSQPDYCREKSKEFKIKIPVELFLEDLNKLTMQIEGLENNVLRLGLDYIKVFYERISENRQVETERILTFLGTRTNIELNTQLTKVSPSLLKESIENYEEIVQAIRNTPYATYLE